MTQVNQPTQWPRGAGVAQSV